MRAEVSMMPALGSTGEQAIRLAGQLTPKSKRAVVDLPCFLQVVVSDFPRFAVNDPDNQKEGMRAA